MRRIVILPYFGEFNDYFPLWLDSCRYNSSIDWLIITDATIPCEIPANVRVVKQTFDEFRDLVQSKFEHKIVLDRPYKLCDYKAYYGYILEEFLVGYDFWGYCDCDVIFGDIDQFLTDEIFQKNAKILRTGHLSFIRNEKAINENFFKFSTYKIVTTSTVIYGLDEAVYGYHDGFAGELLRSGYNYYQNDQIVADIDFRKYPFYLVSDVEYPSVFSFEEGKVYRHYQYNGVIKSQEVMYVHLQKRKMQNLIREINPKTYLIYPNIFAEYKKEKIQCKEFWKEVSTEKKNYFNYKKEKMDTIKRDIRRILHEEQKIDCLLYRLKIKK